MNFLKKIFANKIYTLLLTGYILTQFFWPLSELFFIASIISAVIWISKAHRLDKSFSPVLHSMVLNFTANLLLTLIYIPTLIMNPDVNWALQGRRQESDPMILLAYFPTVNFLVFCAVIFIETLSIKVSEKK